MAHRNLIKTLIGIGIGVFFIWLSARDWPLHQLIGAVRLDEGHLVIGGGFVPHSASEEHALLTAAGWSMEVLWLLPYLAVLIAIHVLRVVRYKPLLDPIVKLSLKEHNRIGAVGFMAMFLFPLRLGELVRPYLVKKGTQGVRMSEVLATVVVERVVDGLVVALLLFGILSLLPHTDTSTATELKVGAALALALFSGATLLLAGARWQHARTRRFVQLTAGLVSKRLAAFIDHILEAFLRGLRRLPNARAFALFVFLTLVYWGINGIGVWFMARAFHLPVDLVGAYAMMACVVVGMMIPNSPGNVGSFWYFLLLPILLYGVSHESTQATAFGLTVWLMQLVQQTAFGAWFILRRQVSWKGVVEATYEDEESLAAETEVARV
ncbi:MAG: flippase-like domain-containing protein [Deltaproteobacteria bacterium]|nr:MAG: flippase-like domain-containing protein [Deltaproteobacteria bacterium]